MYNLLLGPKVLYKGVLMPFQGKHVLKANEPVGDPKGGFFLKYFGVIGGSN